jgi:hypothetical protein
LASWAFNFSVIAFFSLMMASICELLADTEVVLLMLEFSSLPI